MRLINKGLSVYVIVTLAVLPVLLGAPALAASASFTLNRNESRTSPNGRVALTMRNDGYLILSIDGVVKWSTNTNKGSAAVMQNDGNFVVYDAGMTAVWNSGTAGNPGARLEIQDDGNLVIYSPQNAALWSTMTMIPAPGQSASTSTSFSPLPSGYAYGQPGEIINPSTGLEIPRFDPCTGSPGGSIYAFAVPEAPNANHPNYSQLPEQVKKCVLATRTVTSTALDTSGSGGGEGGGGGGGMVETPNTEYIPSPDGVGYDSAILQVDTVTKVVYKDPQTVSLCKGGTLQRTKYKFGLVQFSGSYPYYLSETHDQSPVDDACADHPSNDDILVSNQPQCIGNVNNGALGFETTIRTKCRTYVLAANGKVGTCNYRHVESHINAGAILGFAWNLAMSAATLGAGLYFSAAQVAAQATAAAAVEVGAGAATVTASQVLLSSLSSVLSDPGMISGWFTSATIQNVAGFVFFGSLGAIKEALTYNALGKVNSPAPRLGACEWSNGFLPSSSTALSSTISSDSCTVALGASTCATTVTWNSNSANAVVDRVDADGSSNPTPFAAGSSGSQSVQLGAGPGYYFRLFADSGKTQLLAVTPLTKGTMAAAATTSPTSPVADHTPPSIPKNPVAVLSLPTQAYISWDASVDNNGVAGYKIYRNGAFFGNTGTGTSYNDITISPATSYTYTITAYDAAGNESAQSAPVTLATSPPASVNPANSTPAPASNSTLRCSSGSSSANVNQPVQLTANGGDGNNYAWSAPDRDSNLSASGSSASVSYGMPGTKNVTVSSGGQSASCGITIISPSISNPGSVSTSSSPYKTGSAHIQGYRVNADLSVATSSSVVAAPIYLSGSFSNGATTNYSATGNPYSFANLPDGSYSIAPASPGTGWAVQYAFGAAAAQSGTYQPLPSNGAVSFPITASTASSIDIWFKYVYVAPTTSSTSFTASLSASPNPCAIPSGSNSCTVTVTWSSNAPNAVIDRVDADGVSNAVLFATGSSGSQPVQFGAGPGYKFRMFADSTRTQLLAVTGLVNGASPTATSCLSTYSATVTLSPSTVAPGGTGKAIVVISGSNPGGFSIALNGAAAGNATGAWSNYQGNPCQSYHEVPFTAGQSSGTVSASLNFWGTVGSAALTVSAPAATSASSASSPASLRQGDRLVSPNGRIQLVLQADGNLVAYSDTSATWSTGTHTGSLSTIQADGNFVLYDSAGTVLWSTNTAVGSAVRLVVQDDGNVVLYRMSDSVAVWSIKTGKISASASNNQGLASILESIRQVLQQMLGSVR